jgi:hypothetical protein
VLVRSPDGQLIAGIHSASSAHPVKLAHFPADFRGFDDKRRYADWVFVARIPAVTNMGSASAAIRP